MPQIAHQRDPRSIITPDAFEVSSELLGLPLALPARRLAALLVDLLVIGVLTIVTRSFAMVLGLVAAVFFVRAGFKRVPVEGSVFNRAMRFSVGCLGVMIGLVTMIVWGSLAITVEPDDLEEAEDLTDAELGSPGRRIGTLAALGGAGAGIRLVTADDAVEAEAAARVLIEEAMALGVEAPEVREILSDFTPEDAPWAEGADSLYDRLLAERAEARVGGDSAEAGGGSGAAGDASASAATGETAAGGATGDVDLPSGPEALEALAEVLRAPADSTTRAREAALRERVTAEVAADTLAELTDRIEGLESDVRLRDSQLALAEAELEEASSGGTFEWFREFVDELGFGFGWASLYLTIMLSWWNGQTIGKRLLGVRVLRLDGGPITWWVAFERAGGYAAGFATGLLGFAQVYWDANRQCIHDRIVGTVVVREGAPKVLDFQSTL
jgi:hypothetical protein